MKFGAGWRRGAMTGLAVALGLCAGAADAQTPIPVRVGAASNIGFGPFFVLADEKLGIAAKHGITWDMRIFATGAATLEAAVAGQIDTPVFTPQVGLEKIATGQVCLQGVVTFVDIPSVRLVGYNDIKTAQDVVGKKIGTLAGGVGDTAVHLWLEQNGIAADKVKIVNVSPPDLPVALARHDVDAIIWVEPTPSQALQVTGADKVHYISELAESFRDVNPFNLTCDWVKKYGDEGVKKVIAAWIEASDYIRNNTEKAAEITAKRLQLDPKDVLTLWKNGGWLDGPTAWPANITDGQIDMLTRVAKYLVSIGKMEKVPDFRIWIKPRLLREVAPERVMLKEHPDY